MTADPRNPFRLHDAYKAEVVLIGAERAPVICIDNFLNSPELLVDHAASHAAFQVDRSTYYPGARALIPQQYGTALSHLLHEIIWSTFGKGGGEIVVGPGAYSIVTMRPEELQTIQRVPHTDGTNKGQIALLHYLCSEAHGGTSFYRHRRTGYEVVDDTRSASFQRARDEEWSSAGLPEARYMNGDNAQYERIHSFDAAFNRMLIYRSVSLHSGNIAPDFRFDGNPRTGRLTANTFFLLR